MSVWVHIEDKDGKLIHYINTENVCDVVPYGNTHIKVKYVGQKYLIDYPISIEQFRTAVKEAE